ncbi:MAG: peptidase T [Calditrichaceae bacterium]|nr:peptidase T [Calditrichaceae bacterium]MBN2708907.1 peptidase T [Calditrichaceae bacterium]RQV97569.1 MAG: peptidase T [Calditrichota bacterium]
MLKITRDLFLDRFLNYVKFDTQSSEESETYPSTLKQLELCKQLKKELEELGLEDVEMTQHGYVFGTLPANTDSKAPVIGLIAHVDTSPEVSGENVQAVINKNYDGKDIILKNDPEQVIEFDKNPALKECIGHDIITTDGTTLLGADNKAGIAEIMGALVFLKNNPDIKHGRIRVAFTVDEEVGTGTKYFEVKQFGADYAYTIDGETAGEIEDETFCADTAIVKIKGVNVHPGYAKNKLINGIKIAADFIERLPKDRLSPETTEKREGYLHPHALKGAVELTEIIFLVRDFTEDGLKEKEAFLQKLCDELSAKYAPASLTLEIKESYRNMKYILEKYPHVVDYALEAVKRAGLKPVKNLIRGGTDGARLSFMGLPTPNVFTGGHNFHSKKEWISIQDMEKAVETIVHLVQIWHEKS